MNLLITGGSGFLGAAFLVRLVKADAFEKIFVLLRPSSNKNAEQRLHDLIRRHFSPDDYSTASGRLVPIEGDLTKPKLGISAADRELLVHSVNQILHSAANTDFSTNIRSARLFNVEGTKNVVDLAFDCMNRGHLLRFDYISTAFVAGTKSGVVSERDLERDQSFSNAYELSKYEAEVYLDTKKAALPITIHRPSIVVGQSTNGYTPHFRVIYLPLKLLARNNVPFIPIRKSSKLDIVPIDFVADAIIALILDNSTIGETFYITAGRGNQITTNQLLKDSIKLAGIRPKMTIPSWLFKFIWSSPLKFLLPERLRSIINLTQPYLTYILGVHVIFDAEKSARKLNELGISPPKWDEYSEAIFAYCRATNWGQHELQLEYLYYANDFERRSCETANNSAKSGKIRETNPSDHIVSG